MEKPILLNPLTLAFMGDAVYEQYVRELIIKKHGSLSAGKLHKLAVGYVRAGYQSEVYDKIVPLLDESELSVLKRGRNSSSISAPKNANISDYRKATGVEALIGFLHLSGEEKRLIELFEVAFDFSEVADE